jgi:hypothetical protein
MNWIWSRANEIDEATLRGDVAYERLHRKAQNKEERHESSQQEVS